MKAKRVEDGCDEARVSRTSWSPADVSLKNPWFIAGLLGLLLAFATTIATLYFDFPRSAAITIVKIDYCGYWIASLIYDLRGRHLVKATFDAIFLFVGFLWH